jgi:DNA-binding transcriptional LysR family regulator
MNYTINQLIIYLKVVETKSITKASEELYMTQPAVSIQLKNFQDQFRYPLTEVIGRRLHITDFGQEIAASVSKIVDEMNELKFRTKEYEGHLSGRLKISSASTGKYVIPFFLTDFIKMHSGIDLVLDVTNRARVIESLKNNDIDFALVSRLPEDLEVEEEILLENKLYLIGDKNEHFDTDTLIYREKGSATRFEMEKYFNELKGLKRKKIELTSNEAVKQAVLAGLGSSILPLIGIKSELLEGNLTIIPREDLPIKTQWRLIWLKNKKMTAIMKAYLDFIQQNKSTILDQHFAWYTDY